MMINMYILSVSMSLTYIKILKKISNGIIIKYGRPISSGGRFKDSNRIRNMFSKNYIVFYDSKQLKLWFNFFWRVMKFLLNHILLLQVWSNRIYKGEIRVIKRWTISIYCCQYCFGNFFSQFLSTRSFLPQLTGKKDNLH